jgi:hypothetical protein
MEIERAHLPSYNNTLKHHISLGQAAVLEENYINILTNNNIMLII